ncbi:unnamed protein product [Allacma fusca]|uniref:HTH CENPB-type domain-containing protein n=1 Tax=Allacma fusca TaxID=39272 RepID=A0A8J2JAK9_9HEXA|nr:unnamed protein product [Allacma fusca]
MFQKYLKHPSSITAICTQGRNPVFNKEQEEELVSYLISLANRFYGMTRQGIGELAFRIAERNGIIHPFQNGTAGEDWIYGFLRRHQNLSLRTGTPLSIARIARFTRPAVYRFFNILEEIILAKGFNEHTIFNVDETGVTLVPSRSPKRIAQRGCRNVSVLVAAERGSLCTIICCVSANGRYIPPLFTFPQSCGNVDMAKAPKDSTFRRTSRGWSTTANFLSWLKFFRRHACASEQTPVLLVLDNHSSHISYDVVQYCHSHFIELLSLPPHSTHKMQPLDIGFFSPLKENYKQELTRWYFNHMGQKPVITDIPEILCPGFNAAAKRSSAINSFRKTGIWVIDAETGVGWPNRNAFDDYFDAQEGDSAQAESGHPDEPPAPPDDPDSQDIQAYNSKDVELEIQRSNADTYPESGNVDTLVYATQPSNETPAVSSTPTSFTNLLHTSNETRSITSNAKSPWRPWQTHTEDPIHSSSISQFPSTLIPAIDTSVPHLTPLINVVPSTFNFLNLDYTAFSQYLPQFHGYESRLCLTASSVLQEASNYEDPANHLGTEPPDLHTDQSGGSRVVITNAHSVPSELHTDQSGGCGVVNFNARNEPPELHTDQSGGSRLLATSSRVGPLDLQTDQSSGSGVVAVSDSRERNRSSSDKDAPVRRRKRFRKSSSQINSESSSDEETELELIEIPDEQNTPNSQFLTGVNENISDNEIINAVVITDKLKKTTNKSFKITPTHLEKECQLSEIQVNSRKQRKQLQSQHLTSEDNLRALRAAEKKKRTTSSDSEERRNTRSFIKGRKITLRSGKKLDFN